MSDENLTVETRDGVAVLTFNRPEVLNALNRKTLQELIRAAETLGGDEQVKVVIATGAGRAFIAGADIKELRDLDEAAALGFAELGHKAMDALAAMPKPVIAAVNGFALGGGVEVALACDFIFASDEAKFGFPEVNLGIFPGHGGTQRASRRIGRAWAKELIFTGAIISAAEAERIGLVNRVFPADELLAETRKVAETIAAKGTLAVRGAKRAIEKGCHLELAAGCAIEREVFAKCFATEDRKEGMTAFLEKRSPEFKGR